MMFHSSVLQKPSRYSISACLLLLACTMWGQQSDADPPATILQVTSQRNDGGVAEILRLGETIEEIRGLEAARACGSLPTMREFSLRQELLESVLTASFDVDGVLAEIGNERAQLEELRAALQGRRDRAIGLMNVANLITGTGIGIAVNALQFSSSTANIGNSLGVASGAGSTVLSIIGIRKQRGPLTGIGRVPNMLAPLFGRETELNAYYPPSVMQYLDASPGGGATTASRLDQLKTEWIQAGRLLPAGTTKADQKLTMLTASENPKLKLTIDDLTDRIAMLNDVGARVSLMKRDLGRLMPLLNAKQNCAQ